MIDQQFTYTFGLGWQPLQTTMAGIVREVARKHGVSPEDIRGPARTKVIVRARQEAMWRMRQVGLFSYPQIGRFLGGRDHTTVLYGVRAFEGRGRVNSRSSYVRKAERLSALTRREQHLREQQFIQAGSR